MNLTDKEVNLNGTDRAGKSLSRAKKIQLNLGQKKTLEAFLERGAISKAQFDKSLGNLKVKMGMSGLIE